MNVVFIQKSAGRGGAKNSLVESLTAIMEDGVMRPRVIVGEHGAFNERCAKLNVPLDIVPLPEWRKLFDRLRFPGACRRIARQLKPAAPDWIISNEMWWAPHAARIAKHMGCRSAVILRDGIATIPKARQYRLAENDLILPVSSTIAEALMPDPAFAPRTHVLFNSVRVPTAGGGRLEELRAQLGAHIAVKRWLLVVGKIGARKNQTAALHTLRLLMENGYPDLGLILAGDLDPDYAAELDQTIQSTRLSERVVNLGNFEDLPSLFSCADTVLLTSYREGLPRSLVESLIGNRPAFTYPCEGVDDIYGAHRSTFVSASTTPESLFNTLRQAWENPEKTTQAFDQVRAAALQRFAPAAHLERLQSLLRQYR
jgi:glycosyltransferase involved in cell wall biosynthesis